MAPPVKRAGEGDPSAPSDLVVMAQVKEPYGLKGWIKLYMFGEARDGLDMQAPHQRAGIGVQRT